MGRIATQQMIFVDREGTLVTLHIREGGTLKMPRDAAHQLAQDLMTQINAIDKQFPVHPWRKRFQK